MKSISRVYSHQDQVLDSTGNQRCHFQCKPFYDSIKCSLLSLYLGFEMVEGRAYHQT